MTETINQTEEKKPKKLGWKIFKIIVFLLILGVIGYFFLFAKTLTSVQKTDSWINKFTILRQIKQLAVSADRQLKGEATNDRVNILLLGMGGKNHSGGYLTDTIMLLSIQPSTKKVSMVSVPRDLAVPMENRGWRKINNVNAFAEQSDPGSGGIATSQAISDVLGVPVDYFLRVDFQGFKNVVDILGGLTIDVENAFDDYRYPITGEEDNPNYYARYEHLHLETGPQEMNGSFALKYARSRHALGIEGSDFSRARRQQKIIEAVKQKLLEDNLLLNPEKLGEILNQLNEHIGTNMEIWEMLRLWSIVKKVEKGSITNKVLDNSPSGLLEDSISSEGAYILSPRSGDFSEVQYMVNNIFNDGTTEEKKVAEEEKATVEVRNGTWINGLASKVSIDLEKSGFIVSRIANYNQRGFEKSVIYNLIGEEKKASLDALLDKTNADLATSTPNWLVKAIDKDIKNNSKIIRPDFILVLGQNADKTRSGLKNKE